MIEHSSNNIVSIPNECIEESHKNTQRDGCDVVSAESDHLR